MSAPTKPCAWCPNPSSPARAIIHLRSSVYVCRECALRMDGLLGRRKVAIHDMEGDFSPANLKRLAAAGIMDANALFLPAGRLSAADADARDRAQVLEVSA